MARPESLFPTPATLYLPTPLEASHDQLRALELSIGRELRRMPKLKCLALGSKQGNRVVGSIKYRKIHSNGEVTI